MPSGTVLIVDDERNIRATLARALELEGFETLAAATGLDGLKAIREQKPDVVLLDVRLPDVDGLELLDRVRRDGNEVPVVMISGHGTIATAVRATHLGARDFLEKPLSADKVIVTVKNALEVADLTRQNTALREDLGATRLILGESPAMAKLADWIARTAPTAGRVLITGENGTGKELVARALHDGSPRAKGPFIRVNCAAIPTELIESELFGHEKGAFTGADRQRRGRFEQAHRGTLFLDEIGDMRVDVQAKLLRVLQEGEVERVGGDRPIRVDVRVLAATNKDLEAQVEKGEFREDLFFRLNVVPIVAPPLRDRKDDIPLLVAHFLRLYAENNDFRPKTVVSDAMDTLCRHTWPGNIRELKNLVERLSIMVSGDTIEATDLPSLDGLETRTTSDSSGGSAWPTMSSGLTLKEVREMIERHYIADALESCGWNVTQTARTLGIERTNLHKKIKYYALER